MSHAGPSDIALSIRPPRDIIVRPVLVIDPQDTFYTPSRAANCTPHDGTNRARNAIALIYTVSDTPRNALSICRHG